MVFSWHIPASTHDWLNDWYEIEVILFLQPATEDPPDESEPTSKFVEDLTVSAPKSLVDIDRAFRWNSEEQQRVARNSNAIDLDSGDDSWFVQPPRYPSITSDESDAETESSFGSFPDWLLEPGASYDRWFDRTFSRMPFSEWFVHTALASMQPEPEEDEGEVLAGSIDPAAEDQSDISLSPEELAAQQRELVNEKLDEFQSTLNLSAFTMKEEQVRLPRTGQRLSAGGAHILKHFRWQQFIPTRPRSPSRVFFQSQSHQVEGYFDLSKGRFIHLDVHLWMHLPEQSDEFRFPVHELKELRRLRRGEVHYFDHPKFGLIAEVVRVELPAELQTLVNALD